MEIPTIQGQQVLLRKIEAGDVDDRLRIGRHHAFVHMCGGNSMPQPEHPGRTAWENWYAHNKNLPYYWIIEVNGACIGEAAFHHIVEADRSAVYRIGIFDPAFMGQGIGTEVTKLLLQFGFDTMRLHRIELRVLEYNRRAIRCYEKCDFVRDGILRENAWVDGAYHSDWVMSVLEQEYRQRAN